MSNNAKEVTIQDIDKISFTRERAILTSAIPDVFSSLDPGRVLRKYLVKSLSGDKNYRNIYVIGFGKASLSMYSGIHEIISKLSKYSGLIIPEKAEYENLFENLEVLRGTHPIVSSLSVESTNKLLERIGTHGDKDLIIVLVSGGGSALFESPVPGVDVKQLGEVSQCLMNSGANIRELNIIRHSMSRVKGGKLAELLYPSKVESFVISDVPGDDLQLIASGPLVKPDYRYEEFNGILEKYSRSCPSINGIPFEFPNFENDSVFSHTQNQIILKNLDFVNAFASYLTHLGENVTAVSEPLTGDVKDVSQKLVQSGRDYFSEHKSPVWIIGGGETTVSVKGKGIGGRNCELSLRVSRLLDENEDFTFTSIGTDGIDGISPAMGGITDTWFRHNSSNDDIDSYLERNDSYTLLDKMRSAIMTGYTGTNVSDIFILYYNGTKK